MTPTPPARPCDHVATVTQLVIPEDPHPLRVPIRVDRAGTLETRCVTCNTVINPEETP